MKTIQPTPSQAAVVLKKFMSEIGVELKLGQTQEAIARVYGYSNWNALSSDLSPRGRKRNTSSSAAKSSSPVGECKKCGSFMKHGYCSDTTCPFSDWPQNVDVDDLYHQSTETIEAHYGIRKRKFQEEAELLTLRQLRNQGRGYCGDTETLSRLRTLMENAALDTGLLTNFRRQRHRDEVDAGDFGTVIEVSFDRKLSEGLVLELVFVLRNFQASCRVSTLKLFTRQDDQSQYWGFLDHASGLFDTEVKISGANATFEQLVVAGLKAAATQEAYVHARNPS